MKSCTHFCFGNQNALKILDTLAFTKVANDFVLRLINKITDFFKVYFCAYSFYKHELNAGAYLVAVPLRLGPDVAKTDEVRKRKNDFVKKV